MVDDSPINLQIACELLEKVPLVLDTACDGEEAVAKVRANNYDCVLMDIQMPRMDGYTATGILREDYPYDDLPILAMTANVMAEDRTRTREAGMNGHIAKPVDPADLYQSLATAIPVADYTANLPKADVDIQPGDVEPQQAPLPDALPGLDIKQGLGRLANNEKLFVQLLSDLLSEYSGEADSMQALIDAGNNDELSGAAHKIRGISNNLGAMDIGACAEVIEKAALAGDPVTEEQVQALAGALAVVAESHATLMAQRQSGGTTNGSIIIDTAVVFSDLQSAVAAFDPGATDLIDQLIAAQEPGSELEVQLSEARTMLDNFNFGDAEPLLARLGQELQA